MNIKVVHGKPACFCQNLFSWLKHNNVAIANFANVLKKLNTVLNELKKLLPIPSLSQRQPDSEKIRLQYHHEKSEFGKSLFSPYFSSLKGGGKPSNV